MTNLLPQGFEELERFSDTWGSPSTNTRMMTRASSSMAEIREFYDIATTYMDAAMTHCEQYAFDAMPEDAEQLYCLILGLAQAAVAIEIHGQPRAPNTPWPNSICIERGAQPFG